MDHYFSGMSIHSSSDIESYNFFLNSYPHIAHMCVLDKDENSEKLCDFSIYSFSNLNYLLTSLKNSDPYHAEQIIIKVK